MSSEDFIILPNGKTINLRDTYGKIEKNTMPERSVLRLFFGIFDTNYNDKLNSSEITSIFDSLKTHAATDGNNVLSEAELIGFINEHCPEEEYGMKIRAKDMLKFFDIVQKESDKSLKNKNNNVHIENSLDKIFPELKFLNLGPDNNIDTSKLSLEEIKKHYPQDKYEIEEKTKTQYIFDNENGTTTSFEGDFEDAREQKPSRQRKITTLNIINKDTQQQVVFADFYDDSNAYINISDEKSRKRVSVLRSNNGSIKLYSDNKNVFIANNMIYSIESDQDIYYFDEGVLEQIENDNTVTFFKDGVLDKVENKHPEQAQPPHEDISDKFTELLKSDNIDTKLLSNLIQNSVQRKSIGLDMDDYFAKTGRELCEDIKNANIPDDIKNKLQNSINFPFVDSSYYDADKKIENSKIDNKYYTSEDEYSVQYNGAIINILNKTSGKTTRINLKTIMKDFDFSSSPDMKSSLKNLQNYPGEVLENLGIEISSVRSLEKKDRYSDINKMIAAGFYIEDSITTDRLGSLKGGILVHELGHAIDDIFASHEFKSKEGKFKEAFDKAIKKLESQNHERYNDQHPMRGNGLLNFIKRGTNYATYNEKEAFAICLQILMGYNDSNTKFVKKCMPELIDVAKEVYLEIRKLPNEDRRRIE